MINNKMLSKKKTLNVRIEPTWKYNPSPLEEGITRAAEAALCLRGQEKATPRARKGFERNGITYFYDRAVATGVAKSTTFRA